MYSRMLLCAAGAVVATSAVSYGGLVQTFTLVDHPDANQDPPPYGLRFDELFAGLGGANGGVTTFSFDAAFNDAGRDDVTLTVDSGAGTIVIEGEVYGGEDTGGAYGFGEGWYDVYFEYTSNVTASGGGWIVDPGDHLLNTGYVRSQGNADIAAGTMFDFSDINMSNSFELLPDGHRIPGDNDTWVGRGWLTDETDGSDSGEVRDWLFVAIPTPGTLALAGFGLVCGARRRRSN